MPQGFGLLKTLQYVSIQYRSLQRHTECDEHLKNYFAVCDIDYPMEKIVNTLRLKRSCVKEGGVDNTVLKRDIVKCLDLGYESSLESIFRSPWCFPPFFYLQHIQDNITQSSARSYEPRNVEVQCNPSAICPRLWCQCKIFERGG